jgi:proton-dependent oligopeptide transporter, POT family
VQQQGEARLSAADIPADGAKAGSQSKEILGHPRGLAICFLTEMWERFSFYGMRALLVLYLTQHFLFGDEKAQGLYAAYASLVYLMPVLGGLVADRYLGPRKAVTIGALLLVLGHFGMAFEGSGSRQFLVTDGARFEIAAEGRGEDRTLFVEQGGERLPAAFSAEGVTIGEGTAVTTIAAGSYTVETVQEPLYVQILFLSLSLIIVGVGFLKPNISTIVGKLYGPNDPRRDGGFTIFYMGINLGSVLATFLCGWLGIAYGWKYGFGLAGIGMLAGLVVFLVGQPWLEGRADPPEPEKLKKPIAGVFNAEFLIYLGGFLMLLPAWWLVQRDAIVSTALTWIAPALFLVMFVYSGVALKGVERGRMLAALVLTAFSVLFWTLFEQAGSSLTLFADRNTDLTVFGDLKMNAAQVQLFNPALIVLLAPLFSMLWSGLAKRNLEPTTPVKFALGLAQVGLGFLVLVWGARNFADGQAQVALIWLFLAYLLHTTGELCLSPVGLSMITKLSVPRVVGLMMGVWFLSSALAHTLAGMVAQSTSTETVGGVVVDARAQLDTYASVFWEIGLAGVVIGVVLFLLAPVLKKAMGGIH